MRHSSRQRRRKNLTQSSLTRRELSISSIPALKGRAKFSRRYGDEVELLDEAIRLFGQSPALKHRAKLIPTLRVEALDRRFVQFVVNSDGEQFGNGDDELKFVGHVMPEN